MCAGARANRLHAEACSRLARSERAMSACVHASHEGVHASYARANARARAHAETAQAQSAHVHERLHMRSVAALNETSRAHASARDSVNLSGQLV
eukprot:6191993-Pleurochrysis_carterae.AAC.2